MGKEASCAWVVPLKRVRLGTGGIVGRGEGARVEVSACSFVHLQSMSGTRIGGPSSLFGTIFLASRGHTYVTGHAPFGVLLRALRPVLTSYQSSTRLSPPLDIATHA